ncbi:hypothetical protein J3998_01985 [Thiomicrorhabdus sp. 6S2-11]|uniref:VanZ-like domain-containing protein n=1 Tax=Thiomicrorhabdus marina TaxID=2818442 RepID=A0ABS3Q307_9GAMM|nr:hypothetical protein [Thiomicrorhabdus marina]MBO1926334.1 hypothetical protein [Thiomicrorhabdus marina]
MVLRVVIFLAVLSILLWGMFRAESPPELWQGAFYGISSDKFLHFFALLIFSVSAYFVFQLKQRWILWASLFIVAGVLEFLQNHFQPSRQFSYLDMAANVFGVFVVFMCCQLRALAAKWNR